VPDTPEAVRERAKWLEGREQVSARDGCSPEEALEQIRNMIVARKIWPLRWDPDPGTSPPRVAEFWQVADIDPDTGQVFDDYEQGSYPGLWHRYPREEEPEPDPGDGPF